jgi:hypothetical protein
VLLPLLLCIGLLSPRRFVEVKVREFVTLGSLDPRRLLWRVAPFVAVQGLLWPLGSSRSFCGLCLKFVVRDSISAQKEINSGR